MTDTSTQTLSKNKLKSQLRNLERKLLKFKSTMHANEIVETERKVNTLRHQLTSFTSTTPSTVELNLNKKSKCYYQYKAVRFIERVKTVRRIKQFEKENDLEKLNQAKLDLCYVMVRFSLLKRTMLN
ncbi:18S rRNA maturation protein [Coelomomyces lativittatus]|nr:18S rRNA maturation protein [Coelomomyces lativittatus]KAJ1515592.1 18S rRNA maturation protein [Coelomomyces lativittatus]